MLAQEDLKVVFTVQNAGEARGFSAYQKQIFAEAGAKRAVQTALAIVNTTSYSVRCAITGSFFDAMRDGIRPAGMASNTLIAASIPAAPCHCKIVQDFGKIANLQKPSV